VTNWCQIVVAVVVIISLWRTCVAWWHDSDIDDETKHEAFPILLALETLWIVLLWKAGTFSTIFP
jgi:hypothetical protein